MYTKFYELRQEAFLLTPDPNFLHLAEPHREALGRLMQGILGKKGFLVLSGPVGTGKTTLLHSTLKLLMDSSISRAPIASAFLVNPTLTREEFIEAVLAEFEIPCTASSKPRRLSALQEFLQNRSRAGGTSVLIVDEAHLLSPELLEELRMLGNADTYGEKLLQVVLSAQPDIWGVLNRPQSLALRQRIAMKAVLRELSLPETRVYIAQRLFFAGMRGDSPFTSPAVELIFENSNGVPRIINLICDHCLTSGAATKRRMVSPDMVEDAVAALGLDVVEEPVAVPETRIDAGPAKVDQVLRTVVDQLIEVMRQRHEIAKP